MVLSYPRFSVERDGAESLPFKAKSKITSSIRMGATLLDWTCLDRLSWRVCWSVRGARGDEKVHGHDGGGWRKEHYQ